MEIGIVRQVDIEHEMRSAYLDYAMSVITARALPDVRDGLKPVQRRILYAMDDMGIQHDKPYKKSARIVGEVLGKYHPHGDSAVYDAMVRMAQDFTMRYPLVDGQGNFGSVDGDNPAAMRYTEARLAALAGELLADVHKDTVDFMDNFDGSLREPQVLPARLPNLVLNGVSGIAVAMATNIPPHNLAEICDATIFLIEKYRHLDSVSVDDLMNFVQGPDFPTGGTILGLDGIRSAFATGRGSITVRAKVHFEDAGGGKSLIIVTELPYQVGKASLIEKIAELVRDKRIDTLSDLRDESDRQGMRIVIELKRGLEPQPTLMQLFKFTPMQSNFNVNMIALVDGEPRLLSLKRTLQLFIEYRQEVITRRSRFELERAKLRAHILEGLLIALDHLDEVIDTIRRSRTADTALRNLMRKFTLTEVQARAILDLQLRRLAALERRKIEEEYAEVQKEIKYLEGLLRSRSKVLNLIKSELQALKAQYGDARLTRVSEKDAEEITIEDLVPEQDLFLVLTQRGYVKSLSRRSNPLPTKAKDPTKYLVATNTLESVVFCTNKGQSFTIPVHQIPDSQTNGVPLSNVLTLEAGEEVVAAVPVRDFKQPLYVTMCTAQARIKRTTVDEFSAVRSGGLNAINLDDSDELRWVRLTDGNQQLVVVTADGQALRFSENDVRPMGRNASGVNAMKLASNDRVIHMDLVEEGGSLLVATEKGYAKRSPLADYPQQSRYGRGVSTFSQITSETGRLAAAAVVSDDDTVGILCASGKFTSSKASEILLQGRTTRGAKVMEPGAKDSVTMVIRLASDPWKPLPTVKTPDSSKKTTSGPRRRSRQTSAAKKRTAPTGKAKQPRSRKTSSTSSSKARSKRGKS